MRPCDWKVLASALLMLWLYVTVATAAYLLRDRTLTVRFEIDGKGVASCTGR